MATFKAHQLTVEVIRDTPDLVQLEITDDDGHACKVDLGVFWQARTPILLEIGPVLHPDDAVAGKMDALFNRWAPRDFLDIDTIITSGRYGRDQLLSIAAEHNPGFSVEMFVESLSFLSRIPDREFIPYGVDADRITAMRARFADWQQGLQT
ncbi:hypothetical protein OHA25_21625 [Nonomuraea sp. NBC_00507]|uniref:hypothetical protein n=1 Tax=Nonomuraea sp. NBC_00507 TaxID=2976002 RepID=UPI002E18D5FA